MTRIRTLEFLPSIFQTPTNSQFLGATLDQLVNPPVTKTIDGFIGSKLGFGINAKDYYVTEPTKIRKDYQLEPGVVFTKTNESVAKDFLSYPGILDALKLQNGITDDNNRLFNSQFYSWDSFTSIDMLVNFNEYYWLPQGLPAVTVTTNTGVIDVLADIIGKVNYTSPNGIIFTNGLKIIFESNVLPIEFNNREFYVQGVGTSIELVDVLTLVVPENYTDSISNPYDALNYAIGNYDSILYVPANPDYITIARNAKNKNAWSRSNRWFHIDVIKATAEYLNDPVIVTTYGNANNKAVRPIIEFYPDLKLFNSGTVAKNAIDFIDTRTTDAFTDIAGQASYYPDVQTYTDYTGTIFANPSIYVGEFILGQKYKIENLGSTTVTTWQSVGPVLTTDGDFIIGTEYIITELGLTNWNQVAGTIGQFYSVGSKFVAATPGTNIGAGAGKALTVLFTAQNTGIVNSADFEAGKEYFITNLGTTPWDQLGAIIISSASLQTPLQVNSLIVGQMYVITNLGSTSQAQWNTIAGTSNNVYKVGTTFICVTAGVGTGQAGVPYYIKSFGSLNQTRINAIAGTTGITYSIGDLIVPKNIIVGTNGSAFVKKQFTTNIIPPFKIIGTGLASQGNALCLSQTTTTLEINSTDVIGTFSAGMYINDLILNQQSVLPVNTRIYSVSEDSGLFTLEVFWSIPTIVSGTTNNTSFVASTKNNTDLSVFSGARIVFANEENQSIKNKIYVVNFNDIGYGYPVITLTEAVDSLVLENDQFVVVRGQNYQGKSFYYKDNNYILGQQKPSINIQPKFDIFNKNGISLGNLNFYESSTFEGCDLFRYKIGTGVNDSVLGFPLSYSSLNNISDIIFEVALNTDTFNYVSGVGQNEPVTENVNLGFIHSYFTRSDYEILTGWQTAIAPSTQYQVFEFEYTPNAPPLILENNETIDYEVVCDVPTLNITQTVWPNIQVLNNNNLLTEGTDYTVTYNSNNTVVNILLRADIRTVIQVLLLSNQVSKKAYYTIPINLSNNPFNTDITSVDIGDIRSHFQTVFYNNQNSQGVVFGSNNTRDLGNIVPYGTKIIQNSASLVLPAAFLRNPNLNLFNSLEFNSREYIKFKTLLVDTVNKTSFDQKFDPAFILDNVLEQIATVKNQDMPFFWSDMLPNKAAYITNVYTMANTVLTSIYPLSKIYDYTTANYNGLLIYVQTTVDGVNIVRQLYKNIDYVVSDTSPSVTVTYDLVKGDKVIVKEYNQTYGSYVPNTPTKLGLYPATIPSVVLDTAYNEPTYFIRGHDGSYNKLYGQYLADVNLLVDFRDQVLLEFETRVYNNLKLQQAIPIKNEEIVPGYFRTTEFSYEEWLRMYSPQFLNWIGQNRLDYKTQLYLANNPWTFNYRFARDRLDNSLIKQGYWRGIYQYYYDTTTPDQTPWEMIGYNNKPSWWENRYGPSPYTNDNLILWTDLSNGYDYNNGFPVIREQYIRPGLLNIIPVNDTGELLEPFYTVIGNFNNNTLQKDWIVGDDSPVELSYRRSSTYPFDLMRLYALMDPANFFNLGVDLDNYRYNPELNQYLFNERSHLIINQIQIYGNGTAKTSYINWIVDYEKQLGLGATEKIETLLDNLDVRLVYRMAGFSDKTLLKFFVEKGNPDSKNASLLIPDESYAVLLYENQAYSRVIYSSVIIQLDNTGYKVYGNSQNTAYFTISKPIINGNTSTITIQDSSVKVANDYYDTYEYVPYGTYFYTAQEVAQFLTSYQRYLESEGIIFKEVEEGIEVNWQLMIAEFLYWAQVGWTTGSILTVNPSANTLHINKESTIVQPLTIQQTNFILNQNLYPINNKDLAIYRDGADFKATTLNQGDTISYAQFNMSNIEHGIVFDNTTLFDDVIYNLVSGLKQNRIYVRGTKSAEWNGTMFASGFIYNQDNVNEWSGDLLYTKGSIIKYKNKYWTALKIIQPNRIFNELDWKETEYDEIQKGLLPNPSTRSFESALYYNIDKANLEQDADLLGFSLIGFRPRPYMTSADLTDITQVNVYKNLIKEKGTRNILNAFKKANLTQGEIDYDVYENWAILSGEFGGVLNSNFIEFRINENKLTANPTIFGLTTGNDVPDAQQVIPIYSLFNYARPISNTNILPILSEYVPSRLFPEAGYVNYNDVKLSAYFYSDLATGVDKNGTIVTINDLYVNQYVWVADYLAKWQIFAPFSIGQILIVRSNLNGTSTVFFKDPHNLNQYDIFSIINFDSSINGYYVANQIINPYQVLIVLTLSNSNKEITGEGIALGFNNQRVQKPSEIKNLPLLNYEFTQNKVWVDENSDSSWAVYRKSINYAFDLEITRANTVTFGNAVTYTLKGDYLIGDSGAGIVYRYQFDVITGEYEEDQILLPISLINPETYGTSIVAASNFAFISKPKQLAGLGYVQALVVNDTPISDDYVEYQKTDGQNRIPTVPSSTNFGETLAVSEDANYLFVSDFDDILLKDVLAINLVIGDTYQITSIGTTNFIALGAISNTVGVIFTATSIGTGTGTADRLPRNKVHVYRKNNILLNLPLTVGQTYQITELGDTDFTLVGAIDNKVGLYFIADSAGTGTGKVTQCNYELVYTINGISNKPDNFGFSLSTNYYGDLLFVGAPYEDYTISDPDLSNWGRSYVYQRLIQNFEIQVNDIGLNFELVWTPDNTKPLSVYVNGTYLQAVNYNLTGNIIKINVPLKIGDILTVSGNEFVLSQILETQQIPRVAVEFGYSLDNNKFGTEIVIGAPYALSEENQEGAAYRYTYGSARFGYVVGTNAVNVTTQRTLLLNGYAVIIPVGSASVAAKAINDATITNVQASATNNILTISVINQNIAQVNQKLLIGVTEIETLTELGFSLFTQTQIILCPHEFGPTQFGSTIKFNEFNSLVISAPVGTRFAPTTFDFTDDSNLENDTIFDNNSTQFLDSFPNAGAVYMYDYLGNYNESLQNIGAYTYAQSLNANNLEYGSQPYYGTALDFAENKVIIGTPDFRPTETDGQAIIYINNTGIQNWQVFRQSNPIVDISRIQNTQLFSAETNQTLINLDYMDPLQGKLLGAIAQNIDVISNVDPASYNNSNNTQSGFVWGSTKVGTLWYDTSNVRYINYHQNSNEYNARYWGTVFPGSDVAIYSWIASNVPPANYQGQGIPKDISLFTVQTSLNSSNQVTPIYYFWVRNTGIVFSGKTLADITLTEYILNPQATGISYMSPIAPNAFALYNSVTYINANDTVFHIGYNVNDKDDISHQEYTLIRENYPSDFLPGFPNINKGINFPESLYDRMLDSLSGTDETGGVVPNPFLPKAVQSGIYARPRQSFFYNRYVALQNYLQFVNAALTLYPITETRRPTYLNKSGTYYNTEDFWQYVNWWALGFNNNTKSSFQVQFYSDLSALDVEVGTIVTVVENSQGFTETYIYSGNNVWTRIGLQNGTIEFKTTLYNYNLGKFGFGGDFYSTTPFDQFPSEETRWIIRSINEQIFTNELLIYRNKGLILLFEYIQAETIENQNYLPWLNKTSLVDISHTIRELLPLENFTSDNQEFLSGYVNEAKPYHVVIKEFIFSYKGTDTYQGNLTDFDLPATYDNNVETFISPELVYSNPNTEYEFLPDDPVWNKSEYNEWFNNYGVSLTGQTDYLISKLASYVTLGSNFIVVENASGFPTNGVIKIADIANPNNFEYISYSSVNLALNTLSGLVRGVNETTVFDHLPGENIYIDLPGVIVLDGGKNYTSTPTVTVFIDTTIYPIPKEPAQLEAIVSNGQVTGINVINPGLGYAVLPDIIIDTSENYTFDPNDVNLVNNTITVYGPQLSTGTMVKYSTSGLPIAGLKNDSWYYINVLENVPYKLIALYTTYKDCLVDNNRVDFKFNGTGTQLLSIGAKAIAITSSYPVRENIIKLRYDRTSYNSQVNNWSPGIFYAGSFVGSYNNIEYSTSSSLNLYNLNPNINNILASNGGIVFPIQSVQNDRQIVYSNFERNCNQISSNEINLVYTNTDPSDLYPSGSTVGFTIGMPVKFTGTVGGGIVANTEYYVAAIVNLNRFKISATRFGPVLSLTNSSVNMKCFTADVIDTAVISVIYPGIRQIVATNSTNNTITVPISDIGTGGTQGLYTGMSLIFTGTSFGGIEENVVYYVTSVIDIQTFTISESSTPITIKGLGTNAFNEIIVATTSGLNVGDKIIFGDIVVDGIVTNTFGNLSTGTIYYIKSIGINLITVSLSLAGVIFPTGVVAQNSETYAYFVNQNNTLNLTNDFGSMQMNVQLPVSPGQVEGQKFTFYGSSNQYIDPTYTIGNLVQRTIIDTFASSNSLRISGDLTRIYNGFSFTVSTSAGGLQTGKIYYLYNLIVADPTFVTAQVYIPAGSFTIGTQYIIRDIGTTDFTTVGATKNSNGSFSVGVQYIIDDIGTISNFDWNRIAGSLGVNYKVGDIFTAALTGSGSGNGSAYRTLFNATGLGSGSGSVTVVLNNNSTDITLTQHVVTNPVFDISYTLGGYNVKIINSGLGFTLDNTILVNGASVGGTTPTNNLTITVSKIDAVESGEYSWSLPITSNGEITQVITAGVPNYTSNDYYLVVKDFNSFYVYNDSTFNNPVSGLNFNYSGFTTTIATQINSINDTITVTNSLGFDINDQVVFAGTIPSTTPQIVLGQIYYIFDKPTSLTVRIATEPNSAFPINFTSNATGNWTMTKAGSLALLTQPFNFNQSIVLYNNRVYECVISNNDDEFVFGKWEELTSDSYKLNAMDRALGYYQPTINMPGKELQQLFAGTTYPNATYLGNPFESNLALNVDTILQGQIFTPTNVNGVAIIFNDNKYIIPVNLPGYSGFAMDIEVQDSWLVGKMSDQPLGLSDIIKTTNRYVMTSTNTATPIFTSVNGDVWSTNGFYVPINTALEDIPYVKVKMIAANQRYNAVAYGNGKYVAVGSNIVTTSDLSLWTETYVLPTVGELFDVEYVVTTFFTGFVAVGQENSSKVILYSTNGTTWTKVTNFSYPSGTPTDEINATLYGITYSADYIVVVGDLGVIYSTDAINNPADPWKMYTKVDIDFRIKLNAVLYADNIFIVVGNEGYVGKSADSFFWINLSPRPTTNNLNALYYNSARNEWTLVGDNNTVVQTFDIAAIPVVWDKTQLFYSPKPPYNIVGAPFLYGYGPEELVPGLISDQLTMIVKTKAGTTWPATLYANVGYDVVSIELERNVLNVYSFKNVVQVPAQLSVFVLTNGLSTSLYETLDYEVDWVNKTVTLNSNITSLNMLRIDVYEVGNGDQLVKASTDNNPILNNSDSGFDEIYLNCNYNDVVAPTNTSTLYSKPAVYHNGQKLSAGVTNIVLQTIQANNSIATFDTTNLVIGNKITFGDGIGGGLLSHTTYFIKAISGLEFTISVTPGGPIVSLTNSIGSSIFITEDFAVAKTNNGIGAKAIFADSYNQTTDYLVYSFFGKTEPIQYGYTIPETQVMSGNGTSVYNLTNYLNATNAVNAIVEVDGLRITPTQYNINHIAKTLTFTSLTPSSSQTVAATTFNDTERQYLNTQVNTTTIYNQVVPIINVTVGILGAEGSTRITTAINHNLVTNEVVTIDGINGSYQLNNQTFIVKVLNSTQFEIYEYVQGSVAANSAPITNVNTYISGGYVWESSDYVLFTTTATGTTSTTEITVSNVSLLVVNTPIYFNEDNIMFDSPTSIPEIIVGQKYFIKTIGPNNITISETYEGPTKTITSGLTGLDLYIGQFEQTNVDRLWVTINGQRVSSSLLKVNPANKLNILTEILAGDEVVITSMMPSATPDEMVYLNCVDSNGNGSVYRSNTDTRTWITKNVSELDTEIFVETISALTTKHEQNNVAPVIIDGYYKIALLEVENPIVYISVYNTNPARLGFINLDFVSVDVTMTGDFVLIAQNTFIQPGDNLIIVFYEADLIYAGGEYMRVTDLEPNINKLTVQRGVNNTASLTYIPKYTEVYSLLDINKMSLGNYNTTWNEIPGYYNQILGDPLQIAIGSAPNFLRVGN